ncbi:MAG: chromate efflux transporter [Marivibrio sp.]|uniref:chromate efflux transporter n=1 Tax=Marivibrio sp. TaxID=2039719 RepID=UPI0032EE8544
MSDLSTGRPDSGRTSPFELLRIFFVLGCTSFGGPVAHLGYFREAFVERRGWFTDRAYADIVALCQFLPGPASSQTGMAIGLARGGLPGMLAAFIGFTAPSAILMAAVAWGVVSFGDALGGGWLVGLKAAAAAVVAQALLGMAKSLAPDGRRAGVAVAGMAAATGGAVLLGAPVLAQVGAIAIGAALGFALCGPLAQDRQAEDEGADGLAIRVPYGAAVVALMLFAALLVLPPFLALSEELDLADRFYRAGALVFGGGHVVLPLLQAEMVESGLVSNEVFLAGYGAAQAMPGPLFTFATFLGGAGAGWTGALIATLAIFLPSMLLTYGALPFWAALRHAPLMRRALIGVNAAVVGLLAAAFVDPIAVAVIERPLAAPLAALCYVAIALWKLPPWAVVIAAGVAGGLIF